MSEVVFAREDGWFPRVIRDGGQLRLLLGAGADASGGPRSFTFPLDEAHAAVIRADLTRHLLLWSAILPLCDAAGIRGPLDEDAAIALLDPILLSAPTEVDALFGRIRWDRRTLIAHGADVDLLERGQTWSAVRASTVRSDMRRAYEYEANRRRARAGIVLAPLDTAILRFTGQYLHGATIPKRLPEAVDPELLPDVLEVIATAEETAAGMRITRDPGRGGRATDKQDWDLMAEVVGDAVRRAHPELVAEAVGTVTLLMCSEAASRARHTPSEHTVSLSDGIVLLLKGFPRKNDEEFLAGVDDSAVRDAVRSIVSETQQVRIDWGQKTLTEIGQEVRAVMRARHPELSEAALDRLGSYYTYLVK